MNKLNPNGFRALGAVALVCVLFAPQLITFADAPTMEDADALFQQQKWTDAAEAYDAITKADPDNGRAWFRLGYSLLAAGELDRAVVAQKKAAEFPQGRVLALYNLACAYARQGKTDEAIAALEQSVNAGMNSAEQIAGDPDFESLRGDARYQSILERLKKAAPTADGPQRQFDFWVGHWDVLGPDGAKVGTNKISRTTNGFMLLEEWTSAGGGTGKSINYFDPGERKWKQIWVGGRGVVSYNTGEFSDGAMHFAGRRVNPDGSTLKTRATYTPNDDGSVRQFIEHSRDDGKTWSTYFDGKYVKKSDRASAD